MFEREITFDRFIRMLLAAFLVLAVFFVVDYLGSVLLPFFVAWLLAYLVYPIVKFVQFKMHVKNRALSILVTMLFIILMITAMVLLVVPPMIEEFERAMAIVTEYMQRTNRDGNMPPWLHEWLANNAEALREFFDKEHSEEFLRKLTPHIFNFLGRAASFVVSIVASFITLLYMFFILLDYEHLSESWIKIFPKKSRPFWHSLMGDVERQLNSYVRGQSLVSFCVAILFCIGFLIIDFPMAIALGIMVGIMNLIPYVHTLALIPTIFLSLVKATETGQNFWLIFSGAMAVFIIVQIIIDMVLTPKIMGKAMGLNPAILLLALSVWGYIFGFIGLIIALPLTTLLMTYYKRYVTKDEEKETKVEK